MKYPTLRILFDRKRQTLKGGKGLVQIEVLYDRTRKYIGTNVKVSKENWNDKKKAVKNTIDCDVLNERIKSIHADIQQYINELILNKEPFSFEGLDKYIEGNGKSGNFIDFIQKRIKGKDGNENYMDAIYKVSPYKNMDNMLPIIKTIDPSNPFCSGDKDEYISFCALSRCMSFGKFIDINKYRR